MQADQIFSDVSEFAVALRELRARRKVRVNSGRSERTRRAVLTKADRGKVLGKTGGRCHICGGTIDADDWQADHVLAHSTGGVHSVDNYLPAHSICNNCRWHYDAEEFQWILKLGVWLRTQIETEKPIGRGRRPEILRTRTTARRTSQTGSIEGIDLSEVPKVLREGGLKHPDGTTSLSWSSGRSERNPIAVPTAS